MSEELRIVQYRMPPAWMEWGAYIGAVSLLAAGILTGNVYFYAAITGMLLYWNYKLFDVIREYVQYLNASEFSKLLTTIAEAELNKQKDGTFQDSECLTKEQECEQESTEGD